MTQNKWLILIILLVFLTCFADAQSNITLYQPTDANNCVAGSPTSLSYLIVQPASSCEVYTNDTGAWANTLTDYDITANEYNLFNVSFSPNTIQWGVRCMMTGPGAYEYSGNFTFVQTAAPYCAVISGVTCASNASLGSEEILKLQLSNTRGMKLELQDCNVWIENKKSEVVKQFNTLTVMQQTSILLDKDGNWLNTQVNKVPLTDSNGYYVFPFIVDSKWAWYGDEYTVHASCNGQEAVCGFNVTQQRLPDVNQWDNLIKEGGGFILVAGLIIVVFFYFYWRLRK